MEQVTELGYTPLLMAIDGELRRRHEKKSANLVPRRPGADGRFQLAEVLDLGI